MKDKLLFLYLKTGGGHISTANAVASYFQKHYTDNDVILIDGFEEAHSIIKLIIVDGYKKTQAFARWFYTFLYACNKIFFIAKFNQILLSLFVQTYIKKVILEYKPKKIVVFHFFLVKPVKDMLKQLNLDIPVITIVTDPFNIARLWSLERDMKYIVYSERAKNYITRWKIPTENITIYPPILNEKFNTRFSPEEVHAYKEKLGIHPDQKVILVLGSGDGIPKGGQIVQEIQKEGIDAHVIIVCGKNKHLVHQANKIKEKHPEFNLTVYGFIDFVYELINIADLVIAKGGPATIMEILMLRKVSIINSYIREQEKGNVEFLTDNTMGVYEPNTAKLVQLVKDFLESDLAHYHQNIDAIQLENGTEKVAKHIFEF